MSIKLPWEGRQKRFYNLKHYAGDVVAVIDKTASTTRLRYLFDKAEQCRNHFGINEDCPEKCTFYLVCQNRIHLHDITS